MIPSSLLVFTGTALAVCLTPGPDMIFCLSRGVANGSRAGILAAAGACSGLYLYAVLSAFGMTQIFAYSPVACDMLRFSGAAYLLWLAWKALRTSNPLAADATQPVAPRTWASFYGQGLLNGLLNPKSAVFFLALFPQFIMPAEGNVLGQCLTLVTILAGVNVSVIAVLCSGADRLARDPRVMRVQGAVVATVFAGLAARLVYQSRPS